MERERRGRGAGAVRKGCPATPRPLGPVWSAPGPIPFSYIWSEWGLLCARSGLGSGDTKANKMAGDVSS